MKKATASRVERLEQRASRATGAGDLAMVVRVDRLGPDGVALPGQVVQGNVDAWIAEHKPKVVVILPDNQRGDLIQRVAGFKNV